MGSTVARTSGSAGRKAQGWLRTGPAGSGKMGDELSRARAFQAEERPGNEKSRQHRV